MNEAENARDQRLMTELVGDAPQPEVFGRFPVERIAQDRRPGLREVNANLVGATSLETTPHVRRERAQRRANLHVRDRSLSFAHLGREPQTIARVATVPRGMG